MFIRFLKEIGIGLALVLATQGCALYLEGDDFHHFHHHHWRHGYSSPQQDRVAENDRSDR